MRTEESRSREAEQNNRRVKQAAAAVAALLLLRRNEAIAMAAGLSLGAIATRISIAVRDAVAEGRDLAQQAATERLNAELATLGLPGFLFTRSILARVGRNALRARIFSARYAQSWLTAAQGDTPIQTANRLTAGRLETLGLTEGAIAFNETRSDLARHIPHLMRMWDSVNDIRTCRICAAAHGTVVGVNEPFPAGEPGAVHPRCLCTWHLLTVNEIR
jgi:hypothetical protein